MSPTSLCNGAVLAYCGDCREVLKTLAADSYDAAVTDPPYHLTSIVKRFGGDTAAPAKSNGASGVYNRSSKGFMNCVWDGGDIAFQPETWAEVWRVLKPGAFIVAFASSRGFGRMSVAIEDAGFITHPFIAWAFGQGFPKATRVQADEWEGWRYGTQALKPAIEPIYVGQKPFEKGLNGTENVLRWGTGALNIDGCRVGTTDDLNGGRYSDNKLGDDGNTYGSGINLRSKEDYRQPLGRWPANLIHDGSDEVLAGFPETVGAGNTFASPAEVGVFGVGGTTLRNTHNDHGGSAARFFYCAKADKNDRISRFIEEVKVEWISASGPCQAKLQVDTEQSLEKATVVSPSGADSGWSTFLSGNTLTALFQKAYSCTISTETNSTTDLRTWSLLTRSLTSGFTGDVRYETANGGSPAESAASGPQSITITLARTASLPGASPALSRTPLKISVSGRQHGHPTTKPVDLMAYLVRLVTRKGGTVLDPFAGSGTTGEAAMREGCKAVLIEREPQYHADIESRMKLALAGPEERQRAIIKASGKLDADPGPLFSEVS
jgi:site-specific DNA-methyltransferase (adenine-specific)